MYYEIIFLNFGIDLDKDQEPVPPVFEWYTDPPKTEKIVLIRRVGSDDIPRLARWIALYSGFKESAWIEHPSNYSLSTDYTFEWTFMPGIDYGS